MTKLDDLAADVHLKFIHKKDLQRLKSEYLGYKAQFSKQISHLRQKGIRLHLQERISKDITE